MTRGWPAIKLGDVADFVRGITFKPTDVVPLGTSGSIACMRTANVQAKLDLRDVWAVPAALCRRPEQRLRSGDVLVSTANSWNLVGKCAWVGKLPWPCTFGGFVSIVRASSSTLYSRYLYWWFASPAVQATLRSYGRQTTNISNLGLDRCRAMTIPLPPIEEQRRIASVLDEAEGVRAKRQVSFAQLKSLKETIFIDMFGDPRSNVMRYRRRTLGEVVDLYAGASLPPGQPWSGQDGGYLLAKVSDLNLPGNEVRIERTQLWTDRPGQRSATCPPNSIVIPKRGGAIGTNKKRLTTRMTVLDPNLMGIAVRSDLVEPRWLYQWFLMFDLISIVSGSSVPQLNKQDLAPLPLAVPPREAQRTFVDMFERVEAIGATASRSENLLSELFTSLEHRAFAGQL